MSKAQIECKRCGECCWLRLGGLKKACKYLVYEGSKTLCEVYSSRLGRVTGILEGHKFYCVLRNTQNNNFPNCPYNFSKIS